MATTMEPTETRTRPNPAAPAAPQKPAQKGSRSRVFMIMGVILLGLVIFGARKWWFGRSHVSTDNAQAMGTSCPCCPRSAATSPRYGSPRISR